MIVGSSLSDFVLKSFVVKTRLSSTDSHLIRQQRAILVPNELLAPRFSPFQSHRTLEVLVESSLVRTGIDGHVHVTRIQGASPAALAAAGRRLPSCPKHYRVTQVPGITQKEAHPPSITPPPHMSTPGELYFTPFFHRHFITGGTLDNTTLRMYA